MSKKLIFIKTVENKTGRNRQTLWRYWTAGKFPKPVKIESANAWLESEVDQWIDSKLSAA